MFPLFINPTTLIFTLATTFGVLVHDMQIDKATTVALAAPAAFISYAAIDSVTKSNDHIHVERASIPRHLNTLRSATPRVQPRDDDRRYIQSKKLAFTSGSNGYAWPSI